MQRMTGGSQLSVEHTVVRSQEQLPQTSDPAPRLDGRESPDLPPDIIKQRIASRPFELLKPETLTEKPFLPDAAGRYVPTTFTVGQALAKLDQRFPQEDDGKLSKLLRQAPADKELHPMVTLAIHTAHTLNGNDTRSSRAAAETSILAQERTNLFYMYPPLVDENQHIVSVPKQYMYPHTRKMNKNAIKAYTELRLLETALRHGQQPTLLDVGAGFGTTAKHLRKKGFEVTSLDPLKQKSLKIIRYWKNVRQKTIKEDRLREFGEMHPTTVEQYAAANPQKSFDIVHFSNFNLGPTGTITSLVQAMAKLTRRETGKTIIGINNADTYLVSNPALSILPVLQGSFRKVKFIAVDHCSEVSQNYSAGGMLGFFDCRKKK